MCVGLKRTIQTFLNQDVCCSLCSWPCDVRCGAGDEGPRVLIWRAAAAAQAGQQALRPCFGIQLILHGHLWKSNMHTGIE